MFRWLNGPGNVFRNPLSGSTNYLNAYDRSGNLLRARGSAPSKKKESKESENEDDASLQSDDAKPTAEKAQKEKRRSAEQTMDGAPLPKETTEDLMPYPMNRQFRSQAVLSEELKDAIWKRVMEDGKSVRDVSAGLGVEMRRVAAVVRLKAVEKEWEKQVCSQVMNSINNLQFFYNDEKKLSISLEDIHYGYQIKLQLSDTTSLDSVLQLLCNWSSQAS